MAEKQQDLIKSQAGAPQENPLDSEFFSRLTLADIYGTYTIKPGTSIVTDIPFPIGQFRHLSREELQEIAVKYRIPSIGSYHQGTNTHLFEVSENSHLIISAGMGVPMTAWAPYVFERGTIMALARSLAMGEKPFILDVGCGDGFVSKLLAIEGETRVLGVDPNLTKYKQLPNTPGDVDFREADIVDLIDELGPTRLPKPKQRLYEIIRKLTDRLKDKEEMHFWAMQHGLGMGLDGRGFEDELRELQELSEMNSRPSPVDVAICSFMRTGTDLTPAIRDGIHPRAIVYVKPMNGLSGIGSYYADLEMDPEKEIVDTADSFNPGRNYITVARWQTFWADDWSRVAYVGPRNIGVEPAEVVVQVHKDTGLKKPPVSTVRTYGWDEEIAAIVSKFREYNKTAEYKKKDGFFLGMNRIALLPAGKAELTPPQL